MQLTIDIVRCSFKVEIDPVRRHSVRWFEAYEKRILRMIELLRCGLPVFASNKYILSPICSVPRQSQYPLFCFLSRENGSGIWYLFLVTTAYSSKVRKSLIELAFL